ncbi:hypothetical protein [Nonomuraea sp. NPDC049158]|uniref:hypothetical protein n=1 Tax=Nonomuraea sp. NPDC049158 TaxID=3155649 RepID=UPI0033E7694B
MSLSDVIRNITKTITNKDELKEKAKDLPLLVIQTTLSAAGQALLLVDRMKNSIRGIGGKEDKEADYDSRPSAADQVTPASADEEVAKPARKEPVIFAPRPTPSDTPASNGSPKTKPDPVIFAPAAKPKPEATTTETAAAPAPVTTPEPTVAPEPVAATEPKIAPEPEAATVEPVVTPEPVVAPEPEVATVEPAVAPEPEVATVEPVVAPEPEAATVEPAVAAEPVAGAEPVVAPEPIEVKPARATKPRTPAKPRAAAKPKAAPKAKAATETVTATETKVAADLAEPLPGYSELTVASLRARMRGKSAEQITELIAYEQATSGRPEVVRMYENRLVKLQAGE